MLGLPSLLGFDPGAPPDSRQGSHWGRSTKSIKIELCRGAKIEFMFSTNGRTYRRQKRFVFRQFSYICNEKLFLIQASVTRSRGLYHSLLVNPHKSFILNISSGSSSNHILDFRMSFSRGDKPFLAGSNRGLSTEIVSTMAQHPFHVWLFLHFLAPPIL